LFHLWSVSILQNSKTAERVKYLVYCMENAIFNLPPHQEQVVWLVDLEGIKMSDISLKMAREIIHVLQDYYPKRLGLVILFNAPIVFQPFFKVPKLKSFHWFSLWDCCIYTHCLDFYMHIVYICLNFDVSCYLRVIMNLVPFCNVKEWTAADDKALSGNWTLQ